MIIGDIQLSYPCMHYEVEVTHFTSRKSTAIEWVILETIMKVSSMDKYSGMSVDDLFSQILTISDSDLLIKPCLIQLQDLGAIIVRGLNDDVELKDIYINDLKLTPVGKQMQKQGLLPGEDRNDNITVYYDVLYKNLFESHSNTYKEEATGIPVQDISDIYNVTFPSMDVRELVLNSQKKSGKKKYQWFHNTTQIKDITNIGESLLWKNVVRKIELGKKGVCSISGSTEEDRYIQRLIFSEGVLPSTSDESTLPDVIFDNPDDELNELFFIDELPSKLNQAVKKENHYLIDSNYWKESYTSNMNKKDSSLIIISNAEKYSFEQQGKSIKIKLKQNCLPNNCIYFSGCEAVYAGKVVLHNTEGYKKVEFGYVPKHREIVLASVIMSIVDEVCKEDPRVVVLLSMLDLTELMNEYIENILDEMNDLNEKADLIDELNKIYFSK